MIKRLKAETGPSLRGQELQRLKMHFRSVLHNQPPVALLHVRPASSGTGPYLNKLVQRSAQCPKGERLKGVEPPPEEWESQLETINKKKFHLSPHSAW